MKEASHSHKIAGIVPKYNSNLILHSLVTHEKAKEYRGDSSYMKTPNTWDLQWRDSDGDSDFERLKVNFN